ncbi:MAG: acyl-CoA thioesterase [Candidatus Eisenbacteria bacterium]|nr:acyl-CoA thioesterase [Candidatus Eisenbacteria bacterium]
MGEDRYPVRGKTQIRVYFADTDHMGVVYHGVYLTWFEIGRTELMRGRGMAYAEVERRGLSLPVTEATMRVRLPAHYDELIEVETSVSSLRTREVQFSYQIRRGGDRLVEGTTNHLIVDKQTGRAVRLPDWLRDLLC